MTKIKFDLERFQDEVIKIMKAGLNDKLDAITVEKDALAISEGSTNKIVLDHIDDDSYVNFIDSKVINKNPFIYHYIADIENKSNRSAATAIEVTMIIEVVFVDKYDVQTTTIGRKIMRYSRALHEVLHAKFGTLGKGVGYCSNLEIRPYGPFIQEIGNDGYREKIGGVILTSNLVV